MKNMQANQITVDKKNNNNNNKVRIKPNQIN